MRNMTSRPRRPVFSHFVNSLIISYPTSANGIIVLLKTPPKYRKLDYNKNQKAQKNHAYARHFCRSWCNGSYTMMAKPMKTLELHYPMIQFLIIQLKIGQVMWRMLKYTCYLTTDGQIFAFLTYFEKLSRRSQAFAQTHLIFTGICRPSFCDSTARSSIHLKVSLSVNYVLQELRDNNINI